MAGESRATSPPTIRAYAHVHRRVRRACRRSGTSATTSTPSPDLAESPRRPSTTCSDEAKPAAQQCSTRASPAMSTRSRSSSDRGRHARTSRTRPRQTTPRRGDGGDRGAYLADLRGCPAGIQRSRGRRCSTTTAAAPRRPAPPDRDLLERRHLRPELDVDTAADVV